MNDVQVVLPIGVYKGEKRYRDAVIRPMTGGTQKKLAQKQVRSDAVKLVNTLLLDCVVSIDGIDRINNSTISSLYIGDRDFLALEIRKISRGNELTSIVTCPQCREKLRIVSDLSKEIQIVTQEDVENNGTEFKVVEGVPQFTLSDPDSDFTATFTFPNGVAQSNSMRYIMKNPVEGTYALMYNSLVQWNGKEPKEVTLSVFDNLTISQSDFLIDQFQKNMPGPIFEIPATCSSCGEDLTLSLVSSDFLFRLRD